MENKSVPDEASGGPEKKIERYEKMLSGSKAIFVLSVSAKEGMTHYGIKYYPDLYTDLDNHGLMGGGYTNVIAAAEIGQYFPNVKLITTSAPENQNESLAKIYTKALIRMGISEQQIELEETSTNTLTELVEMVKMARARNWGDVAILTSETHIKRAQAMLDHLETLSEAQNLVDKDFIDAWKYFGEGEELHVHFLQTEEILLLRNPRYRKIIEDVRKSEPYKKRVKAEEMGVEQIESDTYGK